MRPLNEDMSLEQLTKRVSALVSRAFGEHARFDTEVRECQILSHFKSKTSVDVLQQLVACSVCGTQKSRYLEILSALSYDSRVILTEVVQKVRMKNSI